MAAPSPSSDELVQKMLHMETILDQSLNMTKVSLARMDVLEEMLRDAKTQLARQNTSLLAFANVLNTLVASTKNVGGMLDILRQKLERLEAAAALETLVAWRKVATEK